MNAQQLFNDIVRHVGADHPSGWYIGITSDIEKRLFGEHRVHRVRHNWVHGMALNAEHARAVEAALVKLGFDGGTGGGDHTTTYVYAFRKDFGTVR